MILVICCLCFLSVVTNSICLVHLNMLVSFFAYFPWLTYLLQPVLRWLRRPLHSKAKLHGWQDYRSERPAEELWLPRWRVGQVRQGFLITSTRGGRESGNHGCLTRGGPPGIQIQPT